MLVLWKYFGNLKRTLFFDQFNPHFSPILFTSIKDGTISNDYYDLYR